MLRLLLALCFVGLSQAYTITVFGSSVANGHLAEVLCPLTKPDSDIRECAYQQRVRELEARQGNDVVNRTIDGDTAGGLLGRFDTDLVPTFPDIVFIGLSLGNEGLIGDPIGAFEAFQPGLELLLARSRSHGYKVVLGGCYAHTQMNEEEYRVTKEMNMLINGMDVPSFNFLGTIDDGKGHWAEGFRGDDLHPNGRGQLELFRSIPPTVFDAVLAGKLKPVRQFGDKFLTINGDKTISFSPSITLMHSFTFSFRFRATSTSSVSATVTTDTSSTISLSLSSSRIHYAGLDANVAVFSDRVDLSSGLWHEVTLTHNWARRLTTVFVDGIEAGSVVERITPTSFILGGEDTNNVDVQDFMIFRSSLNEIEATALAGGQLLQSSLEVYAPLDSDNPTENEAVSLAEITVE